MDTVTYSNAKASNIKGEVITLYHSKKRHRTMKTNSNPSFSAK